MTFSAPSPDDLGTALNDSAIRTDRAQMFIDDAVTLCETFCDSLGIEWAPPMAGIVVKRVAIRAYTTTMSAARAEQLANAGSPISAGHSGGVVLWRQDKADLRRGSANSGGAFSVNQLANYVSPVLPPWDSNTSNESVATS